MNAEAPTDDRRVIAIGFLDRLKRSLKLINPKPIKTAPQRGSRGINQAKSAAECIQLNHIEIILGNSC